MAAPARPPEQMPDHHDAAGPAGGDVFCLPARLFNTPLRLYCHAFITGGGVFLSFIVHDYLQEMLVRRTHGTIPLTMTSCEFLLCTAGAGLQRLCQLCARRRGHVVAASEAQAPDMHACALFILLSALLLASLTMGTIALKWVMYPIKVVIKSSKLLPTMLVGVLILKKTYQLPHYVAALLLCGGVIGVTFSNSAMAASAPVDASSSEQALGITLTLLAVGCDGVSPVIQELMLHTWRVEAAVLMFYTNGLAFLGIAGAWAWNAEWVALGAAAEQTGWPFLLAVLGLYGACSYFGIAFLLMLIQVWGSGVAVAVSTLRKVVTVVISFLAFPKQCSWGFLVSGAAVLGSIAIATTAKSPSTERKKPPVL